MFLRQQYLLYRFFGHDNIVGNQYNDCIDGCCFSLIAPRNPEKKDLDRRITVIHYFNFEVKNYKKGISYFIIRGVSKQPSHKIKADVQARSNYNAESSQKLHLREEGYEN